jgi:hypothetical protein
VFKNLRTSTKLLLLCGLFVGSIVLATYSLIREQQIAINFVRQELLGTQYLGKLRAVYAAILTDESSANAERSLSADSALGPWAQSDFKLPEFRRSFAQAVVGDGFLNFSSIQAVPVDRRDLPGAWITGNFTLSNCDVAFPAGIVTLEFASPDKLPLGDDVPEAWRTLCGLLHKQPIALPTGEWYRLKCSMDVEVDDLLDP